MEVMERTQRRLVEAIGTPKTIRAVIEQRVTPNVFFAFAPNERSFNGASLDRA